MDCSYIFCAQLHRANWNEDSIWTSSVWGPPGESLKRLDYTISGIGWNLLLSSTKLVVERQHNGTDVGRISWTQCEEEGSEILWSNSRFPWRRCCPTWISEDWEKGLTCGESAHPSSCSILRKLERKAWNCRGVPGCLAADWGARFWRWTKERDKQLPHTMSNNSGAVHSVWLRCVQNWPLLFPGHTLKFGQPPWPGQDPLSASSVSSRVDDARGLYVHRPKTVNQRSIKTRSNGSSHWFIRGSNKDCDISQLLWRNVSKVTVAIWSWAHEDDVQKSSHGSQVYGSRSQTPQQDPNGCK